MLGGINYLIRKKLDTQIFSIADSEMQTVYPQIEEGLIDFLERRKLNDSKMMMCLRCNVVFDKEATKKMEGTRRYDPRRGREGSQTARFSSNNHGGPQKMKSTRGSLD